jgi:hypothetical protein
LQSVGVILVRGINAILRHVNVRRESRSTECAQVERVLTLWQCYIPNTCKARVQGKTRLGRDRSQITVIAHMKPVSLPGVALEQTSI